MPIGQQHVEGDARAGVDHQQVAGGLQTTRTQHGGEAIGTEGLGRTIIEVHAVHFGRGNEATRRPTRARQHALHGGNIGSDAAPVHRFDRRTVGADARKGGRKFGHRTDGFRARTAVEKRDEFGASVADVEREQHGMGRKRR